MTKNKFDTIVLGLGATGSATVYQLAKRGNHVLGIDQFSPPHSFGSSHGDTRITRQAIGEGEQYTPLSLRSYDIWQAIEQETGKKLLEKNGGLIISSKAKTAITHVPQFFENTIAAAQKFHIDYKLLNATDIRAQFPPFNIKDDEVGYYEYNAGFLYPEKCISAQLSLAKKYGATIHENEKVLHFSEKNGVVYVTTNRDEYEAKKLIISAGPWLPMLLEKEYSPIFKISRQILFWFGLKNIKNDAADFRPEKFPIFIWELQTKKQAVYGFPLIGEKNSGVKIASEQFETTTTPETINREVSQEEINAMYENFVAPHFPALSNHCIKTATCLYTTTPDFHFVIDTHPKYSSIILASPCSGHGFKHSAAVGEALAQLVMDGKSEIDMNPFKLSRFL